MIFHLVDDAVPLISKNIIQEECKILDLEYREYQAKTFLFEPGKQVQPGDILFRPAISAVAQKVEQFMYQPGVSTFYRSNDDVYFNCNNAIFRFQSMDIPVPRTFYLNNTHRDALDFYVEQLGGFPVILKVLGHSRGMGVMIIESQASLYSVVDFVSLNHQLPLLCAYINDAIHWRCIVVGDQVVASYINPPDQNDFRTYGTTDASEVYESIDDQIESLAIRAVHALGVEFGGVDILKHPSGRCYVLEANFPCYYAHAQEIAKLKVANAMVSHLVDKSSQLGSSSVLS